MILRRRTGDKTRILHLAQRLSHALLGLAAAQKAEVGLVEQAHGLHLDDRKAAAMSALRLAALLSTAAGLVVVALRFIV